MENLEIQKGAFVPSGEDKGGSPFGVQPASLPAVEGKGWGEPKPDRTALFEPGPGGSGQILFASVGGAVELSSVALLPLLENVVAYPTL